MKKKDLKGQSTVNNALEIYQTKPRGQKKPENAKTGIMCDNCRKSGHQQKDCSGITKGLELSVMNVVVSHMKKNCRSLKKETRLCHGCGKVGHLVKDYRQKGKNQDRTKGCTARAMLVGKDQL